MTGFTRILKRTIWPLKRHITIIMLRIIQETMAVVRTSPILPPDQRPAWDTIRPMPQSRVSTRRPIIIGHRGAAGLAPENTLVAFQLALDLNIDAIEFDVQRSKDGALIVFHDEDVSRVTDGTGKLWDMTLAEIKALDAGIRSGEQFRGERIPTLEEVFDFLRQTDQVLMIEMKEPWRYPGIEAAVVEQIRKYDLIERIQIRSFYHDSLHAIHRIAPDIALSELWLDRLPRDEDVIYKAVNANHNLYTVETIARLHRRGVQVTAWTVDDLDEARRLKDAGIDGLTTNVPDQLLALFD